MRGARRGFGLLMVVVFMGIIVTILAVSVKALVVNARTTRVSRTWDILESVRLATFNSAALATEPVFRQRVGTNAGQLSQLIGPVNSGDATNYPNACGGSFKNGERDASRNWGPFLARSFDPVYGLATPMGNVDNDFIRITGGGTFLQAVIAQADLYDIDLMDEIFDGDNGAAAGAVRWDTITGTTARLTFTITIDNAC
jgi:hypothetical protein